MIPNLTFTDALNEFCEKANSNKCLKQNKISSYEICLKLLDMANGGNTIQWIKNAISQSKDYDICIDYVEQAYNNFLNLNPTVFTTTKKRSDVKSALMHFATFILSYFNAGAALLWGNLIKKHELAQLVAQTAIFPSKSVVDDVINGKIGRKENLLKNRPTQTPDDNPNASWDYMSSIRNCSQKRQTINGIYQDDNTRANQAIKHAILHTLNWKKKSKINYFSGFEACHIYDSVKDPNYYTSVMNIVLVPRAFAGLTDYYPYVKYVLKYRVYDLFGFYVGSTPPKQPKNYQKIKWR
ncbi:MAG: hypothetical protein HDS88_08340 [Bacteroidales bacterium]|nr:hypothetical protein [Bacteroidales bacterium]